jgi:hypothetical protein
MRYARTAPLEGLKYILDILDSVLIGQMPQEQFDP